MSTVFYPGLETGQRLVITGTRADPDLSGATVQAGEAIMVAGVSAPNDASHAGQTPYTTLTLAAKLAYIYRRDTVTLYGNVVPAHHGPVITETLTATGDPAHPQFTLAQSPVLADPSPTQSGFISSLVLVIDGRTWTWVSRFDDHTSARCYITGTDSQGRTTITLSEPLPHSASTVTASYRAGVGSAGNVRAGQLTQPLTRPLAVAKVTNPLPASGGSDPDGPDDVRTGAPRGLQALGRVVSVQDAADLALSWAGIGKATATLISDSHTYTLKVAVAGCPDPAGRQHAGYRRIRGAAGGRRHHRTDQRRTGKNNADRSQCADPPRPRHGLERDRASRTSRTHRRVRLRQAGHQRGHRGQRFDRRDPPRRRRVVRCNHRGRPNPLRQFGVRHRGIDAWPTRQQRTYPSTKYGAATRSGARYASTRRRVHQCRRQRHADPAGGQR